MEISLWVKFALVLSNFGHRPYETQNWHFYLAWLKELAYSDKMQTDFG